MMVIAVYSAPALDQDGHSCYINEEVAALKTGPSRLVDHSLSHTSAGETVPLRAQ